MLFRSQGTTSDGYKWDVITWGDDPNGEWGNRSERYLACGAAQVMRCLASAIAATYRLPTAQLSRCTTGAPSQADVDRPDPQEVLVSKVARLQFYR